MDISLFSKAFTSTYIFLSKEGGTILLDCGDGALREMLRKDIAPPSAVIISHDHPDHTGGLLSLLAYLKIGHIYPAVYAPEGSASVKMTERFFLRRYGKPFFRFSYLKAERTMRIKGGCIRTHRADHAGFEYGMNALCYEIRFQKKSIFYSGDTAYFNGLCGYARNKDIAIIEATFKDPGAEMPVHMTEKQARAVGKNAKKCILIHKGR